MSRWDLPARWARWVAFWDQREHPRALALTRICLGVVILETEHTEFTTGSTSPRLEVREAVAAWCARIEPHSVIEDDDLEMATDDADVDVDIGGASVSADVRQHLTKSQHRRAEEDRIIDAGDRAVDRHTRSLRERRGTVVDGLGECSECVDASA